LLEAIRKESDDAEYYYPELAAIDAALAAPMPEPSREANLGHLIDEIEDYIGGNVEDVETIDRMGLSVFLRSKLTLAHAAGFESGRKAAGREERIDTKRFAEAPCHLCGYNGPDYYQPSTHPCAARFHSAKEPKS